MTWLTGRLPSWKQMFQGRECQSHTFYLTENISYILSFGNLSHFRWFSHAMHGRMHYHLAKASSPLAVLSAAAELCSGSESVWQECEGKTGKLATWLCSILSAFSRSWISTCHSKDHLYRLSYIMQVRKIKKKCYRDLIDL